MKTNLDNLMRLDDEQLLSLGDNGDDVITVLITRYMGIISYKAGIMSAVSADTEDLMQEGILGLMDAVRTYNHEKGAKFSTYASVCISNRIKTALTKSSKKDIPAEFISEQLDGLSNHKDNPEKILIAKEKAQEISEILRQNLSLFERDALILFLNGSSYEQIAQQLITSRKSVDNALQRARRKLKSVF